LAKKKPSSGTRRRSTISLDASRGSEDVGCGGAPAAQRSPGRSKSYGYGRGDTDQYPYKDLRIAVLTARNDHGDQLIRELQRTRAEVKHIWPIPEHIPSDYDVVYCDFVENLPSRMDALPGMPAFALVVVLSNTSRVEPKTLENCVPHAVVQLPVTRQAVNASLVVARSHFLYEQRLRKRISQLDENLLSVRNIERAKVVLMEKMGLNEEEAYVQLRRQAMERRISVSTLANAIIDAQDVFRYN